MAWSSRFPECGYIQQCSQLFEETVHSVSVCLWVQNWAWRRPSAWDFYRQQKEPSREGPAPLSRLEPWSCLIFKWPCVCHCSPILQPTSTHFKNQHEYTTSCFWVSLMSYAMSVCFSLISNWSIPLLHSWVRFSAGSSDTPVHQQLHGWGGRSKTSHPSIHPSCPDAPHATWVQVTLVEYLLDFYQLTVAKIIFFYWRN